jgi:hypothetical protein
MRLKASHTSIFRPQNLYFVTDFTIVFTTVFTAIPAKALMIQALSSLRIGLRRMPQASSTDSIKDSCKVSGSGSAACRKLVVVKSKSGDKWQRYWPLASYIYVCIYIVYIVNTAHASCSSV